MVDSFHFYKYCFVCRANINVAARVTPKNMRTAINRARNHLYPRVSVSLYNLGNLLQQGQNNNITATIDGRDNIFDGSVNLPNGTSSVVFASRRMKRFMRRVRMVFADGTFASRPNVPPSAQVLQLSAVVRNHVSYHCVRSFISEPSSKSKFMQFYHSVCRSCHLLKY